MSSKFARLTEQVKKFKKFPSCLCDFVAKITIIRPYCPHFPAHEGHRLP
jgi:hypothetical protein